MTCDPQDRWVACYALYKKSGPTISKLQQQLRRYLSSTLQSLELADALGYCQDHGKSLSSLFAVFLIRPL